MGRRAAEQLAHLTQNLGQRLLSKNLAVHRVCDRGGETPGCGEPTPHPPASLSWAKGGVRMPYYIFHYTYGVEYSQEGLPMELQVGEWSLDKRCRPSTCCRG